MTYLFLLRFFNLCYRNQTWYINFGGQYKYFWKKNWFDLNYSMIWLENGSLAHTCTRDLKLGTHLGRVNCNIFFKENFWFDFNLKSNIMCTGACCKYFLKKLFFGGLWGPFKKKSYFFSYSLGAWVIFSVHPTVWYLAYIPYLGIMFHIKES